MCPTSCRSELFTLKYASIRISRKHINDFAYLQKEKNGRVSFQNVKSVTIPDVDFFFLMYFQTTVAYIIISRDPSTFFAGMDS